MTRDVSRLGILGLVLMTMAAACGGPDPAPVAVPEAVAGLVLAADPGAAVDVVPARAAAPRDQAVVVGRVGSVVPGLVVFTLVDRTLPYCGERSPEDDCETPWDYCCESRETRVAHSLVVEAHDAVGRPLAAPELPELRLLDLVAVQGRLTRDPHGNAVLLATGWHRLERPHLPASVRWPR